MLLATKQAKFADFICWQCFSFKIKELIKDMTSENVCLL